jgi:hypothetical protein
MPLQIKRGEKMKIAFLLLSLSVGSAFGSTGSDINCSNPINLRDVLSCNYWTQNGNKFGNPPDCDCEGTEDIYLANAGRSLPSLSIEFSAKGADCSNFIQNDGTYGAWGNTIKDYIQNSSAKSRFLGNGITNIEHACPNWSRLNEEQKTHFWVWVFASLAHDESTCKANARNSKATNGVAVGLLQLDDTRSARSWRGPNCRVPSVSDADNNLKCGLDIMAELLKGKDGEYKGSGAIFTNGKRNTSYWQKLKQPGGSHVGDLIKTHPLCGTTRV